MAARPQPRLIEPAGGEVVEEFFDIGQCRSLPWKRRPEAARLLDAFARPDRGFDAVVIGEPQRAFYGNQFGLTFPVFTHYGVAALGARGRRRRRSGSEAHDLVMTLFGGMSKGERKRIKTRVDGHGAQAATQGRFLGGRPPYGYRLADTGPHPHPEKAAMGSGCTSSRPTRTTAPVVRRIFDEYLAGKGCYAIAEGLTADGIPRPPAHDRARNPHRRGAGVGQVGSPGHPPQPALHGLQVWAKQRRDEVLDRHRGRRAGHETVMRWNDEDDWIWSAEPVHEPIIAVENFDAVQARSSRHAGDASPRTARAEHLPAPRPATAALCGRRMQGHWPRRGSTTAAATRGVRPLGRLDHPPTSTSARSDLLPQIDEWLGDCSNRSASTSTSSAPRRRGHDAESTPLRAESQRELETATTKLANTEPPRRRRRPIARGRLDEGGHRDAAAHRTALAKLAQRPSHSAADEMRAGARRARRTWSRLLKAATRSRRRASTRSVGYLGVYNPRQQVVLTAGPPWA